jgi:hypothetical protein
MSAPAPPLGMIDFWRASPADALPDGYKEWSHFSILAPDFDLIINLSFSGALPRFVVLFSDAKDRWDGDVAHIPLTDVAISPGGADATLGPVSARLIGGRYCIEADLPRRGLRLRFDLTPRARALAGNAIRLSDTDAFNWVVVPHLRATGEILSGGRRYAAIDAPAYHDRNWGVFEWGGDFAWEWATLVPDDADGPALVYSRVSDRARAATLSQSLILWRGGRPVRRFYGRDLTVSLSGALKPAQVFRLPRFAGLIGSGRAADVPRRLSVAARGYGDALDIDIDLARFGQLVAPNDRRPGLTALSEAGGRFRARGRIGGELVSFAGRAQAEFKHAAT